MNDPCPIQSSSKRPRVEHEGQAVLRTLKQLEFWKSTLLAPIHRFIVDLVITDSQGNSSSVSNREFVQENI
ncbi:NAC domain-containing protein 4-like isoform X3 [Gossypium australe]|uniref:NAC domain-containing protein 4-like isoform X3 n=1 Tax=Gossypium australe TaxID=47621 RepID=A0A5B6W1S2_9ROSI|nr:NAC domain-containing protein 4-like isoform X3 [Gossypium australe]